MCECEVVASRALFGAIDASIQRMGRARVDTLLCKSDLLSAFSRSLPLTMDRPSLCQRDTLVSTTGRVRVRVAPLSPLLSHIARLLRGT